MSRKKVLRADPSPMNKRRFLLTLECGHETWAASRRAKSVECAKCPTGEEEEKFIDPDFRRDSKTSLYCAACQNDIKGTPRFAYFRDGGMTIVRPDLAASRVQPNDQGWCAVGPECAKKMGRGWTVAKVPTTTTEEP